MQKYITLIHQPQQSSVLNSWRCRLAAMLFICLSLPALTFAQNKIWDKTIGGNDADYLQIVRQTQDGGYILGGFSYSDKSGDKSQGNYIDENGYNSTDFWIVKVNANGTKIWDKTFGGNSSEQLTSLQQTSDGGYIVGGYSNSGKNGNKTQASKGDFDYWVVKLDSKGNKLWDKAFGGSGVDRLFALQQTSDDGYILGGYSSSGISSDKSAVSKGELDYWVVKLNANGSKVWDRTLGGKASEEVKSLQQTRDGGYILGGSSTSGISGDKSQANKGSSTTHDYWIVKLDPDGFKVWDKTLGGKSSDVLQSIVQTSDGGYILGGRSDSDISGDKTQALRDPGTVYPRSDYWLVKLKPDGTKAWDKTLGGTNWDELQSLQQTNDAGYIVGGYSFSGIGEDKTENNKGYGKDYWVVKLKADGSTAWDKTIGGSDDDELLAIIQTSDGNFILGGYSESNSSGDKSENNQGPVDEYGYSTPDYWLVKIDNSGTNLSQYITLEPIPAKHAGDAPFTLVAKASSGLPVTFSVLSGPATVKNNVFTVTGEGQVTIKVTQPGNATYKPAPAVTRTFAVYAPTFVQKQWDKTLGSGQSDKLSVMIPSSDGGYLLGGSSLGRKSGDKSEDNRGPAYYQGRTND